MDKALNSPWLAGSVESDKIIAAETESPVEVVANIQEVQALASDTFMTPNLKPMDTASWQSNNKIDTKEQESKESKELQLEQWLDSGDESMDSESGSESDDDDEDQEDTEDQYVDNIGTG